MKKYISIIFLVSLFVVGCSEQLSVNSPVNKNTAEPSWVSLPNINGESGISVMSMPIFQASKEIDGKKGGSIKIDERYAGGPYGEI